MLTYVNSSVWQRRTNKIIAAGVIVIGLTMMISMIPQCIYAGLAFIVIALGWFGWMRIKENKQEPPRPPNGTHTGSPVLFLVASQNLPQRPRGPTIADPNDRPPTYDQIVKLDGLPPDYVTVLAEKPPRYEDIEIIQSSLRLSKLSTGIPVEIYHPEVPQTHSYRHRETSNGSSSLSGSLSSLSASFSNAIADVTGLTFFSTSFNNREDSKSVNGDLPIIKIDSQKSKADEERVGTYSQVEDGNSQDAKESIVTS